MILVIIETEAESMIHDLTLSRTRPENYLCQFLDSYLEACGRNSRKTQPAKFAVPPCNYTIFLFFSVIVMEIQKSTSPYTFTAIKKPLKSFLKV